MGECYECRDCREQKGTCNFHTAENWLGGFFFIGIIGGLFTTLFTTKFFIPGLVYLGLTGLYFAVKFCMFVYESIQGTMPVKINNCLKSIEQCKDLPYVDKETTDRIIVLGLEIKKYSNKIIKEIKILKNINEGIGKSEAKVNVENTIKQREEALGKMIEGLQNLIPSIISGNFIENIESIESDLRRTKAILDKTNKEINCLTQPHYVADKTNCVRG